VRRRGVSLVKKNLADTDGECCWITESGMAALDY
jgi:hypothetical protein